MNKQLIRYGFQSVLILIALSFFATCAGSPEETLERIAKETRSGCPQIVDEYTTMTNCEVLPNRTLKFTYLVKGMFTNSQKAEMSEAMKKVLTHKLKQRKEIEFYLVNNVRFEHFFLDAQKTEVMHVHIEALDYK